MGYCLHKLLPHLEQVIEIVYEVVTLIMKIASHPSRMLPFITNGYIPEDCPELVNADLPMQLHQQLPLYYVPFPNLHR